MNILLLLTYICLALYIIPLFLGCRFNVGNAVGIVLFVTIAYFLNNPTLFHSLPFIVQIGLLILLFLIFVGGMITSSLILHACSIKPTGNETVILLGCGLYGNRPSKSLIQRMNVALQYLQTYQNTKIIVSGGKGNDETISEAQAMYTYLREHGIASNRILLEDQSKNTKQNIQFSKQILQQNELSNQVVIATSGYHMYRAKQFTTQEDLKFHALPAKSSWYAFPLYLTREIIAIWVWTIKRLNNA